MDTIEKMNDLNRYDSEDRKEYIEDTAFSARFTEIEPDLVFGTLEITDEMAKQAILAIKEFVTANKPYTDERIERINNGYQLYQNELADADAEHQTGYGLTKIVCNDIIQDLYLTFYNLIDSIELSDNSSSLVQVFSRLLKVDPNEAGRQASVLRNIISGISGLQVANPEAEIGRSAFTQFLQKLFGISAPSHDVYHFKKADVLKGFLKTSLSKAGLFNTVKDGKDQLWNFMYTGVISGMFCLKEVWGVNNSKRLIKKETGYSYDIDEEEVYQLIPVDTRNLIFRKDNTHKVVELIKGVLYSDLLNQTYDSDGELKRTHLYDPKRLKALGDILKEQQKKTDHKDTSISDEVNMDDNYELDADVDISEAHYFPMKVGKKVLNCLITYAVVGDNYYPIRIQPSKYFELNYHFLTAITKDDDVAGIGVPALIKDVSEACDTFFQFSMDMLTMALWGIIAVDGNSVSDLTQINKIQPKVPLALKNMAGRSIKDVIQWYTPPLEILTFVEPMFNRLINLANELSGRGATAQKIAPNPSATEAASIISEQKKPIQEASLKINNLFKHLIGNMYTYYMLNKSDSFVIRALAKRTVDPKERNSLVDSMNNGVFEEVEKVLEITVDDLFVDGLEFEVNAYDNYERQAVQKQQFMQLVTLLMPFHGQVFTDESGAMVEIDVYQLISKLASNFDQPDIWKKVENTSPSMQMSPDGSPQAGAGVQPPKLSASPLAADILGGAMQT